MSILTDADRREILDEAFSIQKVRRKDTLRQREKIRAYYQRLQQIGAPEERAALGGKLRRIQDLQFSSFAPGTQEKLIRSLSMGDAPSDAVFMSFFHVICSSFREYGEQLPKASELLEMKKKLFGYRWVMTCSHSVALFAYTMGLLEEKELENFIAERERTAALMSQQEAECDDDINEISHTTEFFERCLDGSCRTLTEFKEMFNEKRKLLNDRSWRENLRRRMETLFTTRNWRFSAPGFYLEQHGCSHMRSTLDKQILSKGENGPIPKRKWILALSLYLQFNETETNELLRCSGYVNVGFEPWEAGLRFLLNHPRKEDEYRQSLEDRENMFTFLTAHGLKPPSSLFASFPYLATQTNNAPHSLFAALLLDCCAEVKACPNKSYRADFNADCVAKTSPTLKITDYLQLFSPPPNSGTNLTDLLRFLLERKSGEKLPPLDRESLDYQAAAETARKNWLRRWKSWTPSDDSLIMWAFPEDCDPSPAYRRKLLYSLLLYVAYTGHLPIKEARMPALFPYEGYLSSGFDLVFDKEDETKTCKNMAASTLSALFPG